uniref:Glutaredoxin domain-containing protein n=1 Tax=viral metagenome TaxID=1070528 RepID=A0A6C0EBI4_9ZZZZ
MNFIFGSNCYFNDMSEKKCYPTDCNDVKPKKSGWTVYGVSWCPFCQKTINLFNEKKLNYYYYDVEKEPFITKDKFRDMLKMELDGYKTVPVIFRDGKLIGGYSDVLKLNL